MILVPTDFRRPHGSPPIAPSLRYPDGGGLPAIWRMPIRLLQNDEDPGEGKRDILVQRVKDSKKDQEQAKEKLKTTMESFEELTGFQGGSLEKSYKKLNGEYEGAQAQANKLHDRIKSIDQVSSDLFSEWQKEIDQMGNTKLQSQSSALLRDAKERQGAYMKAMRKTEDQ
jgi:Protein of unknown function (DUF2959)